MNSPKKITLFAMTEKGFAFTKNAISKFGHLITLVVIGQDEAISNDFSAEIAELCAASGVAFTYRKHFSKMETEYAIAVSWRWLIAHPAEKLIVFHDSVLPRYRGFAPLVNSLINGESEIGVTALFGASEYDRGAIIHQSAKPVSYPITIAQAITQIDQCYLECANAVLEKIASGEPLIGQAQDDSKATYSLWRDEDDYQIDWSLPAAVVRRTIDALSAPYRGAYCRVNDVPARILGAVEVEDVNIENRHIGKVIFVEAGQPVIVCGEGLIKITACISEDSGESLLPLKKFRSRFS
ncbi:methionyl-tRNA formyltransferase [Pseudomonas muyukensis]|uniref:Methionyl-tRNA formyltransferase n=1 Tax=Pseudomonas muyukensis TaxID=2842357 RepID=A0ABX8M6A3_9PSED|nr:formyltransferase family protein [Pseudomonas muyukensis]QXH34609.1 hypothetical protein KSS95_21045 [Pseudomonas muyukensis]